MPDAGDCLRAGGDWGRGMSAAPVAAEGLTFPTFEDWLASPIAPPYGNGLQETMINYARLAFDAARAAHPVAGSPAEAGPVLTVWESAMPESNGKSNFTAILRRKDGELHEGMTIAVSEYPGRVRYEADCVRWLIGEIADEPDMLDYDTDTHSGYAAPAAAEPMPAIESSICSDGIHVNEVRNGKATCLFCDAVSAAPVPASEAASVPYAVALTAMETVRGNAASTIEDHAKDTYPGLVGMRPQDVAGMWAAEVHDIDTKAFLDEAIADARLAAPAAPTDANPVARVVSCRHNHDNSVVWLTDDDLPNGALLYATTPPSVRDDIPGAAP